MTDISLTPLPPTEAIKYFRAKGYKSSFHYLDMAAEEHLAAFTVAKAMTIDVLQDLRDGIDEALANGQSLGDFIKNLTPLLQEKGWWGRKDMVDPETGETVEAQLGSPRRLKTIYVTNMRRAYAEGQWDRIQDSKDDLPYLMYHGGQSHHPRALHLSWDKMVLPADDPWWKIHYPPKDYGCKCMVTQLSAEQVEARGLKVATAPKETLEKFVNKRTGEVQEVPAGVTPSFNYPMGEGRPRLNQVLIQKMNMRDAGVVKPAIAGILDSPEFRTWYKGIAAGDKHGPSMYSYPVAVLPDSAQQLLEAKVKTVGISDWTVGKQKAHHPELGPQDYLQVQRTLDAGRSFLDGSGKLIAILDEPGGYVSVVKAAKEGQELFLQSFYRLSRDEAAKDETIRKLLRRKRAKKE